MGCCGGSPVRKVALRRLARWESWGLAVGVGWLIDLLLAGDSLLAVVDVVQFVESCLASRCKLSRAEVSRWYGYCNSKGNGVLMKLEDVDLDG